MSEINLHESYARKHITMLVWEYIQSQCEEFDFMFINNKWNIIVLHWSEETWIHYDIYKSVFDIERYINIDWWVIIFHFEEDVSRIDEDEQEMYLEDYNDFMKDKAKYLESKVDYIMELTWDK